MLLFTPHRRKQAVCIAAALLTTGYASYRLYNSAGVIRTRKKLAQIIEIMSCLCEVFSRNSETCLLLSNDIHDFLLSDGNAVPQSLKQISKLGQCPEVEETFVRLFSASTQGIFHGIRILMEDAKTKGIKLSGVLTSKVTKLDEERDWLRYDTGGIGDLQFLNRNSHTDLAKRAKKGAALQQRNIVIQHWRNCQKRKRPDMQGEEAINRDVPADIEDEQNWSDVGMRAKAVEGDFNGLLNPADCNWTTLLRSRRKRRQKDGRLAKGLPEAMLDKMFSEAGVGFASAVVGSVARNSVIAFLDGLHKLMKEDYQTSREETGDTVDLDSATMVKLRTKAPDPWQIADLLATDKVKLLIAEGIRTFVSTAVSEYIDKTKDVNIFDNVVAGITNPTYEAPVQELLKIACKGSVEAFVRTAHEVLLFEPSVQPEFQCSKQQKVRQVQKCNKTEDSISPSVQNNGEFVSEESGHPTYEDSFSIKSFENTGDSHCFEAGSKPSENDSFLFMKLFDDKPIKGQAGSVEVWGKTVGSSFSTQGEGKKLGLHTLIDGVLKALTVPQNRKLFVDLVGTMTSEATRSVCEVMLHTVSKILGFNARKLASQFPTLNYVKKVAM
eukprot:c25380_g1_i1 orf=601-2427(+)